LKSIDEVQKFFGDENQKLSRKKYVFVAKNSEA